MIEDFEISSEGQFNSSYNDPYYNQQWYKTVLELEAAWAMEDGSGCDKVVAVIDAAFDFGHMDIAQGTDGYNNIYYNTADTWIDDFNPTGDGLDDDGNQLTDDYIGWHFFDNSDPYIASLNLKPEDVRNGQHWHGTHMAGLISAKQNNNRSIAGLAGGNGTSGVRILPINISHPVSGNVQGNFLDDAIIYAVDRGADVINLSLGVAPSLAIDAAIEYANDNGVLIIAATGNNNSNSVYYPANNYYTLAVGGVDQNDLKYSAATFGYHIDVAAPAQNVWSTTSIPYNTGNSGGTSVASAITTGTAALIACANPCLKASQIKNIIITTSEKVSSNVYDYNYDPNFPGKSWELGYVE